MKAIVEKLRIVEQRLSEEKGEFLLFALFLREDSPEVWDLLVSAPWIESDKPEALRRIVQSVRREFTDQEMALLSRVVIDNPALSAVQSAMHIVHGAAEVRDSHFFGLQIVHAYIITSQRDAHPVNAADATTRMTSVVN